MKLTDAKVKNAKPGDRPQRFSDGGGMFLEVTPKGAKYWRLAYRFHGKQKLRSGPRRPTGNSPVLCRGC